MMKKLNKKDDNGLKVKYSKKLTPEFKDSAIQNPSNLQPTKSYKKMQDVTQQNYTPYRQS